MAVSRHQARRRALHLLYEADLRGLEPAAVLDRHLDGDDPPPEFAVELVLGVAHKREELDARIGAQARDWKLSRMPILDRNILRLGLWELEYSEVPTAVVIDEAVQLAKELSTQDSGRFVNGVLARVAERPPPPAARGAQ